MSAADAIPFLVALAFCGWFAGAAEWVRANAEQDRADRAEQFAEESQATITELRRRVRKWRGWATQLEQHILDEREASEAEVTPVYRDVALDWLETQTWPGGVA